MLKSAMQSLGQRLGSSSSVNLLHPEDTRGRSMTIGGGGNRARSASYDPAASHSRQRRASDAAFTPEHVQFVRQRSNSLNSGRHVVPDPTLFHNITHRNGSRPPTTGPQFGGRESRAGGREAQKVIYFYEKSQPHYSFTNFSPHSVSFEGKEYPTSEHLFQAMKFLPHRPGLAEHIRTGSKQPRFAFSESKRFSPEVRPDWKSMNIQAMDHVLWLKFTQNKKIREELIRTGDAFLVENAGHNDSFWGNGADGLGRNELGQALMRLRELLRQGNGRL